MSYGNNYELPEDDPSGGGGGLLLVVMFLVGLAMAANSCGFISL